MILSGIREAVGGVAEAAESRGDAAVGALDARNLSFGGARTAVRFAEHTGKS